MTTGFLYDPLIGKPYVTCANRFDCLKISCDRKLSQDEQAANQMRAYFLEGGAPQLVYVGIGLCLIVIAYLAEHVARNKTCPSMVWFARHASLITIYKVSLLHPNPNPTL